MTSLLIVAACWAAGEADPTFGPGGDGVVHIAMGVNGEGAGTPLVLPDQKIVTAGYAAVGNIVRFAVLRLLPNGTPDPTFGSGGKVVTGFDGSRAVAAKVVRQPDGKLVVGGIGWGTPSTPVVARYKNGGGLDPTFGTGGKSQPLIAGLDFRPTDMALLPNGKLLLVGSCNVSGGAESSILMRLLSNGQLDTGFADNGVLTTQFTGAPESASRIQVQPNGLYILGGYANADAIARIFLVRIDADGNLDPQFGTDGVALLPQSTHHQSVSTLSQGSDGAWWIVGSDRGSDNLTDSLVARVLVDGELDPNFNGGSPKVLSLAEGHDSFSGAAATPDGKLLVSGTITVSRHQQGFIARLLPDGELDPDFGTGGITQVAPEAYNTEVNGIAIQPDGKAVAAGGYDVSFGVQETGVFRVLNYTLEPPTALNAAVNTTTRRISLTWTDNSAHNTGFYVFRSSGGVFTRVAKLGGVSAWSDTNAALQASTTYTYKVQAGYSNPYLGDYLSTLSDPVSVTTPGPPTPANGVSAVAANGLPRIDLSWSDPTSTETALEVLRKSGAPADPGSYSRKASLGPNVTTYTDTTVTAGATYTYLIRALNAWTHADAAPISETVDSVPAAPGGLTATSMSGPRRVSLCWADNSSAETRFYIFRKNGPPAGTGTYQSVGHVGANVTTYTDPNVLAGQTYAYKVRAFNALGSSPFSNEAGASVP